MHLSATLIYCSFVFNSCALQIILSLSLNMGKFINQLHRTTMEFIRTRQHGQSQRAARNNSIDDFKRTKTQTPVISVIVGELRLTQESPKTGDYHQLSILTYCPSYNW